MNALERLSIVSKITELLESAKAAKPLQRLSIMPNIFDLFSKLGVKMGDNVSGTVTKPDFEFKSPNKNVQLGISGVNGVHHQINQAEFKDQLVVYSNTKNGIVCSFYLEKLAQGRKVTYRDANISNDPTFGSFNIAATEHGRNNKKNAFDYVVGKDAFDRGVKIAKLAAEVANKTFPFIYKNFTLEPIDARGGVYIVSGDNYRSIYKESISQFIIDVDGGVISKLISEEKVVRDKEIAENHKKFKEKLALGNIASGFVTDDQFKLVSSWEENDLIYNNAIKDYELNTQLAKDIIDTLELFNDKRLKLTQDQVGMVNNVLTDIRNHLGFKFTLVGIKNVAENEKFIVNTKDGEQNSNTDESEKETATDTNYNGNNAMFEKYLAGGFNTESAEAFIQTMHKVNELGLPFDNVKSGVVSWFTANQDQIAA
ncbi:hypothetical protein VXS06_14865 [Photobacterium toruni]|uniref:Uncharacterized protein n=1 Tax=Photobacterium toruni TaxID=1935446 RepID=A0ABU6L8Z4_9GAMM|nr:hypothetical protein [Photobacterium toruni]